jgi:hypothetical protein
MFGSVIEPLLAMGQTLATLIDGDQGVGGEVIQQAGWLEPHHTHQASQAFRRPALHQAGKTLISQEALQPWQGPVPEGIGNKGAEAGRRQQHLLNGI